MRFSQINERIVNVQTDAQKAPYADDVWKLMVDTYAPLGGFLTAASKEEMIEKTGLWKLSKRDGKIVSANIYKDHLGRKVIASGTDGTSKGIQDYSKMQKDDIKLGRAWAEVSGTPEKLLKRMKAQPIPNTLAATLTGKSIISLSDDGIHYTRMIGGEPKEKSIYGVVHLDATSREILQSQGVELSQLPDNIKLNS